MMNLKNASKFLTVLALSTLGFTSIAQAGELDGSSYCRQMSTGGMFGQPAGTRTHCVSFEDDMLTDNANTFFGNPPESFGYVVKEGKIYNTETNEPTEYSLGEDSLVVEETGSILTRQ